MPIDETRFVRIALPVARCTIAALVISSDVGPKDLG